MKITTFILLLLISSGATFSQTSVKKIISADAYILTPDPSPKPRINGAKVFGVRPGSPVIFTISATGTRPLTFSAKNLPTGLKLDGLTGRFSGSIENPGTYNITIVAKNGSGTAEREFRIIVGDKLALTPPMGWNSWNGWGDFVTQENVRSTAEAIVKTGLIDHGWTNVNIDIGWEGKRGGKFNAIQPNERFPDMKGLCDYIHSLGLRVGIYSTPWTRAYFGYTGGSSDNKDGSQKEIEISKASNVGHYIGKYKFDKNDVQQWEEWGIDYLKYDWGERTDKQDSIDPIKYISEELKSCKRDIIFSLCHVHSIDLAPGKLPYVQLWRTGTDIRDVWDNSMLEKDKWALGLTDIWDMHREWREFTKPGNWADPDMLTVGWVGFGDMELHKTRLTPDEQYTHISLWCLWASPLLIGSPVEKLDKFTLSLLSNDEVIEINQDPLGKQAYLARKNDDGGEIWIKSMEDGSKAAGFFNRSSTAITVSADWSSLGIYGKYRVRDLWRQKDLGIFEKNFSTKVPSHGVVLVRMFPGK
jgi:alpha-galactosidase